MTKDFQITKWHEIADDDDVWTLFLGVGCPSIWGGVLTRGVPPGVAAPSSITHHKPDKDDDYGDDGDGDSDDDDECDREEGKYICYGLSLLIRKRAKFVERLQRGWIARRAVSFRKKILCAPLFSSESKIKSRKQIVWCDPVAGETISRYLIFWYLRLTKLYRTANKQNHQREDWYLSNSFGGLNWPSLCLNWFLCIVWNLSFNLNYLPIESFAVEITRPANWIRHNVSLQFRILAKSGQTRVWAQNSKVEICFEQNIKGTYLFREKEIINCLLHLFVSSVRSSSVYHVLLHTRPLFNFFQIDQWD